MPKMKVILVLSWGEKGITQIAAVMLSIQGNSRDGLHWKHRLLYSHNSLPFKREHNSLITNHEKPEHASQSE